MAIIAAVEDAIIAAATAALGATVRRITTVPGGWTMETLKRALQFSPGVYVAFQGGNPGTGDGYLNGRYTVYVVAKGAIEEDRRRGNERVIGAYDMLEILLPTLSVLYVPDIGTVAVAGVENLFRDAMFDLGGTVYGINLALANMPFDYRVDETALADFVLFHAEAYNESGIAGGEGPLIVGEQQL